MFTWLLGSKNETLSTKNKTLSAKNEVLVTECLDLISENGRLRTLLIARNTEIQALKNTSQRTINKETAMPKPTDFYVIIPDHTQLAPICAGDAWTPARTRITLVIQSCDTVFQCETISNTMAVRTTNNPKFLCEALTQEGVVHTVCYTREQAECSVNTEQRYKFLDSEWEEARQSHMSTQNKYHDLIDVTKDLRTELEETRTELEDKESDFDDLHSQFVALTIKHKALKTENEELLQRLAAPNLSRLMNRNEPSTRDCTETMEAQAATITLKSEVSELTKENTVLQTSLISLCTANKELADALLMAYTR